MGFIDRARALLDPACPEVNPLGRATKCIGVSTHAPIQLTPPFQLNGKLRRRRHVMDSSSLPLRSQLAVENCAELGDVPDPRSCYRSRCCP